MNWAVAEMCGGGRRRRKSEILNPKSEGNPKPEIRSPKSQAEVGSSSACWHRGDPIARSAGLRPGEFVPWLLPGSRRAGGRRSSRFSKRRPESDNFNLTINRRKQRQSAWFGREARECGKHPSGWFFRISSFGFPSDFGFRISVLDPLYSASSNPPAAVSCHRVTTHRTT